MRGFGLELRLGVGSPMVLFLHDTESGFAIAAGGDREAMWPNIDTREGVVHFNCRECGSDAIAKDNGGGIGFARTLKCF